MEPLKLMKPEWPHITIFRQNMINVTPLLCKQIVADKMLDPWPEDLKSHLTGGAIVNTLRWSIGWNQ